MSATVTVYAPVAGFTGVVAGVAFASGSAQVERGTSALGYFRRHGYGIGSPIDATPPEPVDPRHVGTNGDGIEPVGTKLRDAAVDPRPGDFLPPTNAGEANPHGPDVVAPGVHAMPPGPIVPGPVSSSPRVQEAIETAVAGEVLVNQRPVPDVTAEAAKAQDELAAAFDAKGDASRGRPALSARVGVWQDFAVSQGMAPDVADSKTKQELIDQYADLDAGDTRADSEGSDDDEPSDDDVEDDDES